MATKQQADNPYTRGMAAFIAGLRYEDIPAAVRARIKLLILDALGCGIYAAGLEWSRILIDALSVLDASRGCGVWGTGCRLSAPHAALANGTLVQGFEIDDVFRRSPMHVGAVTLPPLFAVAEIRPGMSGRKFLTAAVAGYEIGPRVALCMGLEHIGQGWHSGATAGVFSAAAASAAALGLDAGRTVHALGIAGTQAAGLMAAQYGAMVKRMHAGRAAQSGLYGGLLAENGFTGITDVFESPYGGFCTTFSRSEDRFNLAELTSGLGERFDTMDVYLKFYSCAGPIHTTLDAIRELRAERPFSADEVEQVIVHVSQIAKEHCGWEYRPQGVTSAQLNMSYCVATLLLEGEVFVDQFSEEMVADPARLALLKRVEVMPDAEITGRGRAFRHMARVEIRLQDGSILRKTVEKRPDEGAFTGEERVAQKFRTLARHMLPAEQVSRLEEAVLNLEQLADVRPLAQLLAKKPAA